MDTAVGLCAARLKGEEGVRRFAYNDATGARVSCLPGGRLTIGIGVNLETGLDDAEITMLTEHRLTVTEEQIAGFQWYKFTDVTRQSVLLDLAFNLGVTGLLHFPRMLAAVLAKDWGTASEELLDSRAFAQEPHRIAPLATLLLNGGANA